MISLAEPTIPQKSVEYVQETLKLNEIGQGRMIQRLESSLAELVGVEHVIAVSSGTMAATVVLLALRQHPEYARRSRNVYVPSVTFPAQVNAVLAAGLEVDFVDVDSRGLMWKPPKDDPFCVMPAHLLGQIVPWIEQCAEMDMPIIEDACESFGSRIGNKWTGSFGLAGITSFYASHTIAGGEGGAIFTNDAELARLCRLVTNHGVTKDWHYLATGTNGKMSALNAAVILGQLEQDHLDHVLGQRSNNAEYLSRRIISSPWATYMPAVGEVRVPHLYPVKVNDPVNARADLLAVGVATRPCFEYLPNTTPYGEVGPDGNGEWFVNNHILVPCHQSLTRDNLDLIVNTLRNGGHLPS